LPSATTESFFFSYLPTSRVPLAPLVLAAMQNGYGAGTVSFSPQMSPNARIFGFSFGISKCAQASGSAFPVPLFFPGPTPKLFKVPSASDLFVRRIFRLFSLPGTQFARNVSSLTRCTTDQPLEVLPAVRNFFPFFFSGPVFFKLCAQTPPTGGLGMGLMRCLFLPSLGKRLRLCSPDPLRTPLLFFAPSPSDLSRRFGYGASTMAPVSPQSLSSLGDDKAPPPQTVAFLCGGGTPQETPFISWTATSPPFPNKAGGPFFFTKGGGTFLWGWLGVEKDSFFSLIEFPPFFGLFRNPPQRACSVGTPS